MHSQANPIFSRDGGKLPKMGGGNGNLATDDCAIAGEKENYSNAEIIAELARVRCAFQLRTICAVMGVSAPQGEI